MIPEEGTQFFTIDDIIAIEDLPESIKDYVRPNTLTIKIPFPEFVPIWDFKLKRHLKKSNYGKVIDTKLQSMDFPCSFNVKTTYPLSPKTQKTKGNISSIFGYCKHARHEQLKLTDPCKTTFSCKIKNHPALHQDSTDDTGHRQATEVDEHEEDVIIECELEGEFVLFQTHSTCRPAKADQRDKLKEELKTSRSLKVHIQHHSDIPALRRVHNNFTVSSAEVMRKIRSEALSDGSTRSLGFINAMLHVADKLNSDPEFQDSTKGLSGYIRHQSAFIPHYVVMFSPIQLRFASLCDELYLDATGSVVPPTVLATLKRVLLHVAVARDSQIQVQTPVPVLEMLSTVGTVSFITTAIMDFVSKVRKCKSGWTPRLVVTDFCLAYLHSACLAILGESLDTYINRKFSLLTSKPLADKSTILFVCSGHFMRANSKYLRKHAPPQCVFPALHAFARLIETRTPEELDKNVEIIVQLFGNPQLEEHLVSSFKDSLIDGNSLPEDVEECLAMQMDDIFEGIEPTENPKLEREKSHFYSYFCKKLSKVQKGTPEKEQCNPMYSEVCLTTFQRWMTYLPLWSKITYFENGPAPAKTITTGVVEKSFDNFKNSFHTSKTF